MSHHDRAPIRPDTRELWTVWRVDDNGNVFVVREHLSEADARAVAAEFEVRGHKQMYWVEPETDVSDRISPASS